MDPRDERRLTGILTDIGI